MKLSHITTVSAVATIIGGFAAWASMDWPRPAMTTDLKEIDVAIDELNRQLIEVSKFGFETRRLALNSDWWRIEAQLEEILELKLERPRDRHLNDSWRNLKRDQQEIERQIKILDRAINNSITK